MTEDQFQALIAWCNRFDMRLEAIERKLRIIERRTDPLYVPGLTATVYGVTISDP